MSAVIKQPKLRKCKAPDCNTMYQPYSTLSRACSGKSLYKDKMMYCALVLVKIAKEKKERKEFAERKKNLRTKSDWLKLAQTQFNKFIRLRDKDEPCIDCGQFGSGEDHFTGGKWDAGHYLTRGGYPELRFDEDNCHKQLKTCNGGSGKYAKKNRTVQEGFRIRLIAKIGIEKVEWLEGPHEIPHYSIDDLKAIRERYRLKVKELEKEEMKDE